MIGATTSSVLASTCRSSRLIDHHPWPVADRIVRNAPNFSTFFPLFSPNILPAIFAALFPPSTINTIPSTVHRPTI